MRFKNWFGAATAVGLSLFSLNAMAYIGPGLGVETIAVVLGIFFGFILLFVGVIWYPAKRLIKTIRSKLRKHDWLCVGGASFNFDSGALAVFLGKAFDKPIDVKA